MTHPSRTSLRRVFLPLLALAIAASAGGCDRRGADARPERGDAPPHRSAVTALGRVTPGRAVVSIAAQPGSRLLKLEVSEGKKVSAGDVLAYLEAYPFRVSERDAAEILLRESRDRLEAETLYTEALLEQSRQSVLLLEVIAEHERKELARIKSLVVTKAVSEQNLDNQKFLVASREGELAKARAELAAAQLARARVRSTVAVKSAEAQVKSAEAQIELTVIRAPIDGEILKIFTYPGERISNDPILKMGDTGDMHVIAEVHETDVGAVRVGQHALVTSPALPEPVTGVVEEIGTLIYKNDVLDLDPRAPKDTRVVEVRVKLDKSEAVARLIHLEVSTRIDLDSAPSPAASAGRAAAAAR